VHTHIYLVKIKPNIQLPDLLYLFYLYMFLGYYIQGMGERECSDTQVCRRENLTHATCQERTGT